MAASSSVRFPPYFHFRFGRKRYFRPPEVHSSAVLPTPNTPSVEELSHTTPCSTFPVSPLRPIGFSIFRQKTTVFWTDLDIFWQDRRGSKARQLRIFCNLIFPLTREKYVLTRNLKTVLVESGPRYRFTNFIPYGPCGTPIMHSKFLTLPLKFWRNKGTNFWGWGDFGAREPKMIVDALQMSRDSIRTYVGAL